MSPNEIEILEFYRSGADIKDLAESFDYRLYFIKKCLANEPEFAAKGFIYRPLVKK